MSRMKFVERALRRLSSWRGLAAAGALLLSCASWAAGAVTASQFGVSETGAATVSVPIQVPRGIAGMEPQLALNYSSDSGNGLLGLGWTLSGPSVIARCAKNLVADGVRGSVKFAVGDRYCLDGQRIELVGQDNTDTNYGKAGSEYRLERDNQSRITAAGSYAGLATVPSSFKVETKAGLILEFGISANSQVLTNFPSGAGTKTINRWMLQRISDRHGSFVEFVYCGGEVTAAGICSSVEGTAAWSGSKVLHYVRYTNRGGMLNGEFAVMLDYEARPDRILGFHAGSASRQTQRIKSIQTYRDFSGPSAADRGKLVRAYDISYEALDDGASPPKSLRATNTSRIQQIQERDKDGNTLPALQFTLAPDSVLGQTVAQRSDGQTGQPKVPPECGGVIGLRWMKLLCP